MCQVQEDSVLIMDKCRIRERNKTCMKCDEEAVVLARVKDSFCRNCFLAYVTHRFKATIGKSRLIRDKEKILIAFSGGQNSSAVANLVKVGRSESQHKKLRFIPSLVYVDDGIVIRQTHEERRATRMAITRLMRAYGFPSFIVRLEDVLTLSTPSEPTAIEADDANVAAADDDDDDETASKRLLEILDGAKSLTAKEDLVCTMRQRLLAHVARCGGHTKIMVGDNGTRLASRVLSSMAQGRGISVPLEVGFADDREGDSTFVRPLREFPSREIAMYNRFSGVDSVCVPTLATKAGQYASINALTNEFMNGLQVSFPSTVSTVFRTGEKLCSSSRAEDEAHCAMCKAPLDTSVAVCSALESTGHSRSLGVSAGQRPSAPSCRNEAEDQTECCSQGDGSCHSSKKTISRDDLSRWLCYGCRITVGEMSDPRVLPDFVLEEAGRNQRRFDMREEIQEFLLAEADER